MAEKAKVIELKDDKIIGTLQRTDACAGCHACEMGVAENEMRLTAINKCDAKVGDYVLVEITVNAMMTATFLMYVLPLITMVIGFLIGNMYSEIASFILGIAFMLLTYLGIRFYNGKMDKNKYMATAFKIVE
ncbi:MAG: SoxR reducing system RseC family protein [Lachnospirales bacterium]